MLHTPTSQPLFIRHKSAAELLEKQAAAVARMPDDDKRWPAQVLSEMHKQLPFLSRFDVDIEMTRIEPEAGYAIGYAMLRNKTGKQRAAEELGKPTNKIRVPVIVADRLLQPFHVFEVGGKTYPLTQERLESAMMNPSMFDGISDPPGTQSLLDQIYPPFQHRQGYGMMSGDRATTGVSKISSAPRVTKTASGEFGPLREFLQQQELEKEAGIIQNLAGGVRNAAGAARHGFSALSGSGVGTRLRGALGSIRPAFSKGFQVTEAAAARNAAHEAAGAQRFSEARAAVSAAKPPPRIGELPAPAPLPKTPPKTRTEYVPPEPTPTGTASVQAAKPVPGPEVRALPADAPAPKPLVRTTEGSPSFIAEQRAANLKNDFTEVAGSTTPVRTTPSSSGGAPNSGVSKQPVMATAPPPSPEGGGGDALAKARARSAEVNASRAASGTESAPPVSPAPKPGAPGASVEPPVGGSPVRRAETAPAPVAPTSVATETPQSAPRMPITQRLEERLAAERAGSGAPASAGDADPRFVRQAVSPNRSTQVREAVPLQDAPGFAPQAKAAPMNRQDQLAHDYHMTSQNLPKMSPEAYQELEQAAQLASQRTGTKVTAAQMYQHQNPAAGAPAAAAPGFFNRALSSAAGGATMLGLGAIGGGMMMANKASENY